MKGERADLARSLEDRDERRGADVAPFGVGPACKCLDPIETVPRKVPLGLVSKPDIAALKRRFQIGKKLDLLLGLAQHLAVVPGPLPAIPGNTQGDILRTLNGFPADAKSELDRHALRADQHWRAEQGKDRLKVIVETIAITVVHRPGEIAPPQMVDALVLSDQSQAAGDVLEHVATAFVGNDFEKVAEIVHLADDELTSAASCDEGLESRLVGKTTRRIDEFGGAQRILRAKRPSGQQKQS